ncbi:hypothetical protein ACFFJI_07650 [Allobacillus sp. GCM10007491]|uniref:Uncharacterized protein n=1 Tax=Allobacillus saliphilus TaxID=2912308 RepID=A0A941CVG6_9BACI|nr:hypothetical protein [Allobacillus saliphilus]MBR7553276.1 hypothetical protein [Allobacillus saliphilus]
MQELKMPDELDKQILTTQKSEITDEVAIPSRRERKTRRNHREQKELKENEFFFSHLFLNGMAIVFILLILSIPFLYL